MPYAFSLTLPVPTVVLVLGMLGTLLSALSLIAAASPCIPGPFGCG